MEIANGLDIRRWGHYGDETGDGGQHLKPEQGMRSSLYGINKIDAHHFDDCKTWQQVGVNCPDEWEGAATEFLTEGEAVPRIKIHPHDFERLILLGTGGFGKVYMVRKLCGKDSGKLYAMKVLKKAAIAKCKKDLAHTLSERKVLGYLKHPFIVDLCYAFHNDLHLYLILEYVCGGELFKFLEQESCVGEDVALFYVSELVLALEHLHSQDIIYRDLKPENILLDKEGHVKLTDFGMCKENMSADTQTHTFCGTVEYMAPEVIQREGHGKAADWWSLGALTFDMLTGGPPFTGGNRKQTTELIIKAHLNVPRYMTNEAASLIKKLLTKAVKKRLGSGPDDATPVKHHLFFRHVDWDDVINRRVAPPFVPFLTSETDVSRFDVKFTEKPTCDSPPKASDLPLSPNSHNAFADFSYEAPSFLERSFKNREQELGSSSRRRNSHLSVSPAVERITIADDDKIYDDDEMGLPPASCHSGPLGISQAGKRDDTLQCSAVPINIPKPKNVIPLAFADYPRPIDLLKSLGANGMSGTIGKSSGLAQLIDVPRTDNSVNLGAAAVPFSNLRVTSGSPLPPRVAMPTTKSAPIPINGTGGGCASKDPITTRSMTAAARNATASGDGGDVHQGAPGKSRATAPVYPPAKHRRNARRWSLSGVGV